MGRVLPAPRAKVSGVVLPASEYWVFAPLIAIAMVVVVVVRLQEFFGFLAVFQPALLASVGGTVLLLAKSSRRVVAEVFRAPLARLALTYFAFALATAPIALWSGGAIQTLKSFFPAIPLLLSFLFCSPTSQSVRRVQTGLVLMVGFYAAYALVNGESIGEGRLAIAGGMYDSNDMAAMMGLTFPLAVGLALRALGKERLVAVVAAVLVVSVVAASGSRGGIMGTAAGALVLALGMRGSRRLVSIVVITTAALAVWNFSDASFRERMISMTDLEEDYNSTSEVGRQQVWKRGIGYFKENPWIGVGAGNFPMAEGDYFSSLSRRGKWSTAHNTYLQVLAELGLIGGGIFVAMLLTAFRSAWRLMRRGERGSGHPDREQPEFLAALVAYMVAGFFLSHAYYYPLYALLGMIGLAYRARAVGEDARDRPLQGLVPGSALHRSGGTRRGAAAPPTLLVPGAHPGRPSGVHSAVLPGLLR